MIEIDSATELEPAHEFDRRAQAAVDAAIAASTAAAAEEHEASEYVDRIRGDHALGLVARGRLLVAQRALAKAQEAAAAAESAVRATERAIARERSERDAILHRRARAEREARAAERAKSAARAHELWTEIFAAIETIDQLPGLRPLSSAGLAYDRAVGALSHLRRLFNQ